jgi:hypothetical protein
MAQEISGWKRRYYQVAVPRAENLARQDSVSAERRETGERWCNSAGSGADYEYGMPSELRRGGTRPHRFQGISTKHPCNYMESIMYFAVRLMNH